MILINHDIEIDEQPGIRVPRVWLADAETVCECPDFCPVQHDDN